MLHEIDGVFTKQKLNVGGKEISMFVDAGSLTIPTKEEMEILMKDLQTLYENMTDEEIKKYNKDKKDEEYLEWVRMNEDMYDRPEPDEVRKSNEHVGYVYLIHENMNDSYKIGRTKNISTRSKLFSIKLPFDWQFEEIIETDACVYLEKELHNKFSEKRINGEWFTLSKRDVDYFKAGIFEDEYFCDITIREFDVDG